MEQTITLKIPKWLMQTINQALIEIPWRIANPAIIEINRQIELQMNTQNGSPGKSPDASGTGSP